jgi:predicted transcriptional regulator of viral defense system
MSFADATRRLGTVAELQWGLVSTSQAADVGVSRLQLSRMAQSGVLERLAYGIYRLAGVPAAEHEEIFAAWLGLERGADDSAADQPEVVVAGAAAARLHGIGDLWLDRIDFITPSRRSSRRSDVRIRTRELAPEEITTTDGVPVLTAARTIADLVESWTDLSLVADMTRDALGRGILNSERLAEHLQPLAAANGFDSGGVFRNHLIELAGVPA